MRHAVIAVLPLLATAGAATGDENRGIELIVGTTALRDDNLYRLPEGVSPPEAGLPSDRRADRLLGPYVEARVGMEQAGQSFGLRSRVSRDIFDDNDAYDANRLDAAATWQGQFTQRWRTELQYAFEQRVTSFADFRNPERNILDLRTLRGSLSFRPRPDTRLSAHATDYRGSNSVAARQTSDYRIRVVRLEAARSGALGNEVALGASRTDGAFPNRTLVGSAPVDNSYQQEDIDLTLVWRPGEATSALLRGGRATRRFETVGERNFAGPTWTAQLSWQPTGRLALRTGFVRDLNAVDDFDRLYAVTRVQRASLVYALSSKLTAGIEVSRQRTDYRGDPSNFLTRLIGQRPARADRAEEQRVTLAWTPRDRWRVNAGYSRLTRRSNLSTLDFDANLTQLGLEYRAF
jgi:hypothetical protein